MRLSPFAALAVALAISACGGSDISSRAAQTPAMQTTAMQAPPALAAAAPRYDVRQISVTVPPTLKVSEANRLYPLADIVWRGEPQGDRHAQVRAILAEGLDRATAGMDAGVPVTVEAELRRFHSLTEKARYTTGGVHTVHFVLTVRDAGTGAAIDGPRLVSADLETWGAQAAQQVDRQRIVDRIGAAVQAELSQPPVGPDRRLVARAALPVGFN